MPSSSSVDCNASKRFVFGLALHHLDAVDNWANYIGNRK